VGLLDSQWASGLRSAPIADALGSDRDRVSEYSMVSGFDPIEWITTKEAAEMS
jgi:hypothetical protein